jgi:hypothetical protein
VIRWADLKIGGGAAEALDRIWQQYLARKTRVDEGEHWPRRHRRA